MARVFQLELGTLAGKNTPYASRKGRGIDVNWSRSGVALVAYFVEKLST
jgi:hypothetical protein